jgi:hypothetical protein
MTVAKIREMWENRGIGWQEIANVGGKSNKIVRNCHMKQGVFERNAIPLRFEILPLNGKA